MRKILIALGVVATSSCLLFGCAETNNESQVSATTTGNEQNVNESESVEELTEDSIILEETTSTEVPELPAETEQVIETSNTVEVEEQDVITELDKIMYASNGVNLRSGNSTDYEIVGGLVQNEEVHVIGQSSETGWYMIEYGNTTAYVSNNYLSDTKVEIVHVEEEVTVANQEAVQNTEQNVGELYVAVQLWDYDPAIGPYLKEEFDMPREECIQYQMESTGASREKAELNTDVHIKNPQMHRLTLHTEALVNYNGGKSSYNRWE